MTAAVGKKHDIPGLILLAAGFISSWIGLDLNFEMNKQIDHKVENRSVFYVMNHERIWREHTRIYPISRLRRTNRIVWTIAILCFFFGFAALLLGGRLSRIS